ncbi:MAG TPA: hypothetical protein VI756_15080, partial [Blastocatellia bacterium]
ESMDWGLGFLHLDGCNMDDAFVFSTYETIEEWEAEQRRFREFTEEYERKRAAGELDEPEFGLSDIGAGYFGDDGSDDSDDDIPF